MSEINDLEIWHILPILESIGLGLESKPWLELSREARLENHSFVNLTPVLLRAVVDAANDRRIGETILLANWLFQDVALDQISPTDAAIVIRALKKIGQEETAKTS